MCPSSSPPQLSGADLCPRRSFPWFYFWSFAHHGPGLFPSPALPDTSPVISESPWLPPSTPEQGFCQSASDAPAAHPHPAVACRRAAWLLQAPSAAAPPPPPAGRLVGSTGLSEGACWASRRLGLKSSLITHGLCISR